MSLLATMVAKLRNSECFVSLSKRFLMILQHREILKASFFNLNDSQKISQLPGH